jgi:FkbM family methyltransferase
MARKISLLLLRIAKLYKTFRTPSLWVPFLRGSTLSCEHLKVLTNENLRDVNVYFDIGANVGQFALAVLDTNPNAILYCYEPIQSCFRKLARCLKSFSNCKAFNLAVGSSDGQMMINLASSLDSSSLLEVSDCQEKYYGVRSSGESVPVEVITLDSILTANPVSNGFLKIDVQGYELEVLLGCSSLSSHFKYIYVECSFKSLYSNQSLFSDVSAYLFRSGYQLIDICNIDRVRGDGIVQADFLFLRNA